MKILAIDSSTNITSICMIEFFKNQKNILFRYDESHERCNSSIFFKGLEDAIKQSGIPNRVVIGLGPGSYNGLRSSIGAAQGITTALSIDLIGLPSPLAIPGHHSGFWICGDARGGDYWIACVVNCCFIKEPFLCAPSEMENHLLKYPLFPLISNFPLKQLSPLLKTEIMTPDSTLLADLGKDTPASLRLPEPLYLKKPSITLKNHKR